MSDRMTNPEIEDVLSSVRRLVSEEVARDRSGRLVLTPAFRIADPDPAPPAAPEAEPETGAEGEALSLEARIAELEAALSVQSVEFEPDYERGEQAEFPPLREVTAVTEPEPEPEPAPEAGPESEADPAPAAVEPALETADPVEDAGEDAGEDMREELRPAGPPPPPETTGAAPEPGLFDDADMLIDEDSLRLLVRDILREELQGPFGERITRSIRKLVRAEVARALAAARAMD